MDWLREWWGVIMAFFAGAVWLGKMQMSIHALQKETFVTNERCGERRQSRNEQIDMQFAAGNAQFAAIKNGISRLEDSHQKLIEMLIDRRNNERH